MGKKENGTIGKVFPRKGRKNCEGIKFSSCICILWGTRIKMYQLSYSFGIEKKNTRSIRARLTRYREREPFVNRHYKKTRLLLRDKIRDKILKKNSKRREEKNHSSFVTDTFTDWGVGFRKIQINSFPYDRRRRKRRLLLFHGNFTSTKRTSNAYLSTTLSLLQVK